MSEPTLISECIPRYLQDIDKKHCPTVYDEINNYHPEPIPPIKDFRISEIRKLRESRQISDAEYQRFWSNHTEFLEEKWKAEIHNRYLFFRLYDLLAATTDEKEKHAICQKLNLFKRSLEENKHQFPALIIDLNKYPIVKNNKEVEWDE